MSDIYFLDKMANRLGKIDGFSLGSVLINHMWMVARTNDPQHGLSYMCFLRVAFEKKGLNFTHFHLPQIDYMDVLRRLICH